MNGLSTNDKLNGRMVGSPSIEFSGSIQDAFLGVALRKPIRALQLSLTESSMVLA